MARIGKIKINAAALEKIKSSPAAKRAVRATAERVAANVREQNIGVGDRDGGSHEIPLPVIATDHSVVLAHPAGLAVQAKHGSLTKAAAEAGLKLREARS